MLLFLLLGFAAWIATSIVTEAEIFRDVREACDKLHNKHNNWWTYKLRYLIHCPMCTGIWVSAIIALFVAPIVSVPFVGWGLTALAIKGIGHAFFVLQKMAEAFTDRKNSQTEWSKFDLAEREKWMKEQSANDVDSPSASLF
jgi:hypothetical protein